MVTLADFPGHIQDEKCKGFFTVADDHSKLLLPAHLVTKEDADPNNGGTDNIPKTVEPHAANKQQFDSSSAKNHKELVESDETLSPIKQPRSMTGEHSVRSKTLDSKHLSVMRSTWLASKRSSRKSFTDNLYDNPYDLKVGTMIQFGVPPCYGEIKWIGTLPNFQRLMAGVELVGYLHSYDSKI